MKSTSPSLTARTAPAKSLSLAFVRQRPLVGHLRNHLQLYSMVVQARTNSALSHTDDFITLEPTISLSQRHSHPNGTECLSADFMTKCASALSHPPPYIAKTELLGAEAVLSADFLDRYASTGRDSLASHHQEMFSDRGSDGPPCPLANPEGLDFSVQPSSSPSFAVVLDTFSPFQPRFRAARRVWHVLLLILSMLWALAARTLDMQHFLRSVQAFDYHALCSHPLSSYDTLHFICPTPVINNYASFDLGAQYLKTLSSPPADVQLINGLRTAMRLSEVGPHEPSVPLQYSPQNLTAKRCWPLDGSSGRYGLSLPHPIYVTNVTVGHFLDSVELTGSAPRDVTIWALVDLSAIPTIAQKILGSAWLPSHSDLRDQMASHLKPGQDLIPLARMQYNVHSKHVTQGTVPQPAYIWKRLKVSGVVFEIHNNWGDAGQTCLYGVEVYGYTF